MFILTRPKAVQPLANSAECYLATSTASRRRRQVRPRLLYNLTRMNSVRPTRCASSTFMLIPQPPPGVAVDAISDRLMYRLAYRNFGDHESLVMNHTVNVAVNPVFRAG